MSLRNSKLENKYTFRLIEREDIEFIFFLRDISKESVLKKVDRLQSRKFLSNYIKASQSEYYAFESAERIIGYYRYYLVENRIEIGSWITNPTASFKEKILFDLEFKKLVFELTSYRVIHFDVRKHNTSVWKHHQRFGAELISEDELNRYYSLNFRTFKTRYDAKINRIN